MERRLLQIAIALAGLVPVGGGLAGVLLGPAMVEGWPAGPSQDSHYRYLSGLLLAIGLAFWSLVPRIERHGAAIRLLTALVVMGGLARLFGVLQLGPPSPPMVSALAMELAVTPLLCLWQARVARLATAP